MGDRCLIFKNSSLKSNVWESISSSPSLVWTTRRDINWNAWGTVRMQSNQASGPISGYSFVLFFTSFVFVRYFSSLSHRQSFRTKDWLCTRQLHPSLSLVQFIPSRYIVEERRFAADCHFTSFPFHKTRACTSSPAVMSAVFPSPLSNNNVSGQVMNVSMLVEKPCPPAPPPVIVPFAYESPIGWNAVVSRSKVVVCHRISPRSVL